MPTLGDTELNINKSNSTNNKHYVPSFDINNLSFYTK